MPDGIPKPAVEATTDILLRDKEYPRFLDTAYHTTGAAFVGYLKTKPHTGLEPDNCLLAIAKYNRVAATTLEGRDLLSLRNLYTGWLWEDWRPLWDEMKRNPANQLEDAFMEAFFQSVAEKEAEKAESRAEPSRNRNWIR
jgi:hypothetical protein